VDSHRPKSSSDDGAIGAIPIADQVSRRVVPGECPGDLARDPLRCQIRCDIGPDQVSPIEVKHHEAIEQSESDSRHNEQVDGGNVRGMIVEEGPPTV
jgi:hypothetical protein